ncbi:MAG: glycosyltransferase [Mariniphaga sp.]
MIDINGFTFEVAEFALLLIFFLTFFIQLFYQLLLTIFTLSGRKKEKLNEYPSISIIVPSRNYEENLRELIPSLLDQDYPDFEVVVVDDCSADGTEWYLAGLKLETNKLKTSRIIQETDFPNALVITIGVRAASKEWLIFLNPLCRVGSNDWLKSFASGMHPKTEAVFGFVKYVNQEGSMQKFFRYENLNSYLFHGSARQLGLPMPVFDINIAYRRERFLNLKGFAAVLDVRFSENELFINKISGRKNTSYLLDRSSVINYNGETDRQDWLNHRRKQLHLKRKFTIGQRAFLFINITSRLLLDGSMVALLILSPWRIWIGGIWLFKILNELIWGIVGMKRLGEKKLFPGLLIMRTILPLLNSFLSFKQLFSRKRRKW